MKITLDIFSGRPNPTWDLSERERQQLIDRVAGRALAPADDETGILGYRGWIVSVTDEETENLPRDFRIAGIAPFAGIPARGQSPLAVSEETEIANFLLGTSQAALTDELKAFTDSAIRQRHSNVAPGPIDPLPDPPEPTPTSCQLVPTTYQPNVWNYMPVIKQNNCYNYAMSRRTDTFAQPGEYAGQSTNTMSCAAVGAAADADGCKKTCKGQSKKVALVIWPGVDYHWYRQHKEGFWGHKPGKTAARNTDDFNRVINGTSLTPANCARGPYTQFCGYRFAPKNIAIK